MMPYRYRLLAKIAVCAMCMTWLCSVPACDSWDPHKADKASAYVDAQIAATEKVLQDPSAGPAAKADAAEQHEFWLKLAANLADVKKGHDDDAKAPHPAEDAIGALGAATGPYGALLTPLVPIVGWWIREQKWGKRLNQIVASIDAAKVKNPALDAALSAAKDSIHAGMDIDTIRLVESARVKA